MARGLDASGGPHDHGQGFTWMNVAPAGVPGSVNTTVVTEPVGKTSAVTPVSLRTVAGVPTAVRRKRVFVIAEARNVVDAPAARLPPPVSIVVELNVVVAAGVAWMSPAVLVA